MGTISGLAITNLMKDTKKTLIYPLLKKSKLGILKLPIISSIIEFILIMVFLYGLYHIILYPWFSEQIEKEKRDKELSREWKDKLLQEVKDIDMGTVYV
jgi:hypothetical protein